MSAEASDTPLYPRRRRRRRAWVLRAVGVSLAVTLLVWGLPLLPRYTLAPDVSNVTVDPTCTVEGLDLHCVPYPRWNVGFNDPGATAWQEMPIDYFQNRSMREEPSAPIPRWNPYMGSGHPVVFDGHNSIWSPTRWILRHLPGEQGRDVVVFVRAFFWVLGCVLAAALVGAGGPLWWITAIAASLTSFLSTLIDHAMLDVELLAPWFTVLVLAWRKGKLRPPEAAFGALALGALAGSMGFLQSQIGFVLGVAVVTAASLVYTRGRSVILALFVALGFALLYPAWYPLIRNIGEFMTSRAATDCIARGDHIGWQVFFGELFHAKIGMYHIYWVATFAGLVAIASTGFGGKKHWFVVAAFAYFASMIVLGPPERVCSLDGLSGVRFGRHSSTHAQFLFLLSVVVAAHELAKRAGSRWDPRIWALPAAAVLSTIGAESREFWFFTGGAILLTLWLRWRHRYLTPEGRYARVAWIVALSALPSFSLQSRWLPELFQRKLPRAVGRLPHEVAAGTPIGEVQRLSRAEDRRHFSPTGILFPNWGSALGILDQRFLGALYPKAYHGLNGATGLSSRWNRDANHRLDPDRFTGPANPAFLFEDDFRRVMAVNRISLFTFPRGQTFFSPSITSGPYAWGACRILASNPTIDAILCPGMGGVGFFPNAVAHGRDHDQILGLLKTVPFSLLEGGFVVVGPEGLDPSTTTVPSPARGRVLSMSRGGDRLEYTLSVESAGVFVVADTWFPGWTAEVDGASVELMRANWGFKAVKVPAGPAVKVTMKFEPKS